MTLDEAIQHASAQAEEARCEGNHQCSYEHRQLAVWLTELRDRRAAEDMSPSPEEVMEALTEGECLLADGYEAALIGYVQQFNRVLAVYDWDKCIQILMSQGMSWEDAQEFFEFNTLGAWMGEATPVFAKLLPHGSSMITTLESVPSSSESEGD
jgi:hypothetical protein